jgi:hypothetical protein
VPTFSCGGSETNDDNIKFWHVQMFVSVEGSEGFLRAAD